MGIREEFKKVLESLRITSAGDTTRVINTVQDFQLPSEIDAELTEENRKVEDAVETVDIWKEGNLDEINRFGSKQMGNLRAVTTDPVGFFINQFFGRFAKGAGVVALAGLLFEAVKFIVDQLFQPGRIFDIRFRETIDKQVVLFLERAEQAELRQGFKNVITSSIPSLRGNVLRGQLGGNFYNPERIPVNFLDQRRIEDNTVASEPETMGKRGFGSAKFTGRFG